MFTIIDWIFFGVWTIMTIAISIYFIVEEEDIKSGLLNLFASMFIVVGIMFGIGWYHTSTANGTRAMKDYESNINNGINREITITAENGREIFHYEGKIDVETDHDDNYILFDDQDGKRYIIYYGVQDTVLIIEK